MLGGSRAVRQGDAGRAPGGASGPLGATEPARSQPGRAECLARRRSWAGRAAGQAKGGAPLPGKEAGERRRPGRQDCTARAVKRGGRAGGRGGGARGGGLAPERRGVGAIKMHPMELPMEKDGTGTLRPEEVVKEEEDTREAAAAAAGK